MQTFQDAATSRVYAFEDDVVATNTGGVYSFKTAAGVSLTLPTTLVPYVVPTPTPNPLAAAAAASAAAFAAGLAITSTGTPALNGTFADGTGTVVWLDTAGASHTFASVAAFKAFASAVAAYVAALFKYAEGTLTTLPPATATIP